MAEMVVPEAVHATGAWKRRAFIQTLLFTGGFSFIFILMGASATFLGSRIAAYHYLLRIGGGMVVVLFGLHIMGVFSIRFLNYERRVNLEKKPAHFLGAAVVGAAFALGWTPSALAQYWVPFIPMPACRRR